MLSKGISTSQDTNKGFRHDINALRAIAVLGVVLYHYKVEAFQGGFAGVDVFFVISGYLMTRIILKGIAQNNFSFFQYLGKRVERIVPALLVLVVVVSALTFYLYFPYDFALNQKNAAASVVFLSNIFYYTKIDYFAAAAETNLFLHTWSLSVEWQFYLLYPFFLLLLKRLIRSGAWFRNTFIVVTVLMFICSMLVSRIDQSASLYLLPTRAWEMLLGGIAVLTEGFFAKLKYRNVLVMLGYTLIFLCFVWFDTEMLWPGPLTLIPVLATFLVIVGNTDHYNLIRNGVVQFIGKISYSVYLWHWPILVICQYYGVELNVMVVIVLSSLSLILGLLSYRYVESFKFSHVKLVPLGMAVVLVLTICCGRYQLNDILFKKKSVELANYAIDHKAELKTQYRRDTCHVGDYNDFDKGKCLCIDSNKVNVLLIGDSHMGQLAESFLEYGQKNDINFLQATASATLATLNDVQQRDPKARRLMRYVFQDFIPKNHAKLAGVIIGGSWSGQKDGMKGFVTIAGELRRTINYLKSYGLKVIIIGDTERYSIDYPVLAARDYENNTNKTNDNILPLPYTIDDYLKKQFGGIHLTVINHNNFPAVSIDGSPYMIDNHHQTKYGADLIVAKVVKHPLARQMFNSKR